MPGFVNTPIEEGIWARAKKAFEDTYGHTPSSSSDYARVTQIFKKMGGSTKENIGDAIDTLTFNIPLITRVFEYLLETKGMEDADLHRLLERLILRSKKKEVMDMDDYEYIIGEKKPGYKEDLTTGDASGLITYGQPKKIRKAPEPNCIWKKMAEEIAELEKVIYPTQTKDMMTEAKTVGGFESPEPGDLPKAEADILAKVYAKCRADGGDKEKCAKIAWGAVHRAESLSLEESINNYLTLLEKRVYVDSAEEVPPGKSLRTGSLGAQYYEIEDEEDNRKGDKLTKDEKETKPGKKSQSTNIANPKQTKTQDKTKPEDRKTRLDLGGIDSNDYNR